MPFLTYLQDSLPPGTYLGLFHGRTDPGAQLDDWGSSGPALPVLAMHVTYATNVRIRVAPEHVEEIRRGAGTSTSIADGDWVDLRVEADMLYFDGVYYGDWSVFTIPQEPPCPSEATK